MHDESVSRRRPRGNVRQYRLCLACLAWFRTQLHEDAEAEAIPADGLHWPATRWATVCSYLLLKQDEHQLRVSLHEAGLGYTRLRPLALSTFTGQQDAVLFLGASIAGQATSCLRSLEPAQRARVVVVSRFDAMPDLAASLRLGVGDFLASPLTTRQVAGAIQRLEQAAVQGVERRTDGLPRIPATEGLPGRPAQSFVVEVPDATQTTTVAWMLRRFLRGYDHVGIDGEGRLAVVAFCPDAHVRDVLQRLTLILSGVATVRTARAQRAAAGGGPAAPAAQQRPPRVLSPGA